MFLVAGWCSGNIRNEYVNSMVCTSLVYLIIVWIVTGCFRGRRKRVMVREEILWRLKRREERMNARMLEAGTSLPIGGGVGAVGGGGSGLYVGGDSPPGLDNAASTERDRYVDGTTSADAADALYEDYQYYSEDEWEYQRRDYDRTLGQTRFEMNCAHRTLGCYPSDLPRDNIDGGGGYREYDFEDDDPDDDDGDDDGDACTRPWGFLARPCLPCVPCCNGSRGFHVQYCGLCALAQEAREANATLPRHLRMIDHVTLEPFLTYYPRILELRSTATESFWEHCRALSELSKLLLVTFKTILVALLVISLSDLVGYWNLSDLYVLVTTFCQSFAVVYCVHWGWHRYDLSVDAVIKYFACGFVLCTSMAFTVELVGYLLFALAVKVVTVNVRVVQDNGYGGAGGIHVVTDAWTDGSRFLKQFVGLGDVDHVGHGRSLTAGSDVLDGFFDRHPAAKILYILVTSYLITGLVEEVCKYFGKATEPSNFCHRDLFFFI
jgi:hypothetical protein